MFRGKSGTTVVLHANEQKLTRNKNTFEQICMKEISGMYIYCAGKKNEHSNYISDVFQYVSYVGVWLASCPGVRFVLPRQTWRPRIGNG